MITHTNFETPIDLAFGLQKSEGLEAISDTHILGQDLKPQPEVVRPQCWPLGLA